jgi:hypothetical protein
VMLTVRTPAFLHEDFWPVLCLRVPIDSVTTVVALGSSLGHRPTFM